ncbi:L,D-transpeptidase family protein [Tianweitania sp. BSSL-BM11]|uniref:L,D-transpeptidase family protein n=2 Tax=Tianweitania aestuarii TaxID=2814886 RepID=A0ABS5RQB5_9HYPH|nr:L,D-transpeptidase family protein [Tianweitania aestuarii]MBS9719179.1 L,D-transpeptidase family protein [Tianweitania aestuarii]
MRRIGLLLGLVAVLAIGGFGYTKVMARVGSGTPPPAADAARQADRIVVFKAHKRMQLLRGDKVLRTYRISMGSNWNGGHKRQDGDERTPEGRYSIDWRNPRSFAHLSLHISYPNAADSDAAYRNKVSPGGNIMIHGLPNGWGLLGPLHHLADWTDGCIAVTNAEMEEIWSLVPTGTPIEIVPGSQSL